MTEKGEQRHTIDAATAGAGVVRLAKRTLKGEVSRREFLRLATLTGMSYGAAQFLAACAPLGPETPTATATASPTAEPTATGAVPAEAPATATEEPTAVATGTPEATPTPEIPLRQIEAFLRPGASGGFQRELGLRFPSKRQEGEEFPSNQFLYAALEIPDEWKTGDEELGLVFPPDLVDHRIQRGFTITIPEALDTRSVVYSGEQIKSQLQQLGVEYPPELQAYLDSMEVRIEKGKLIFPIQNSEFEVILPDGSESKLNLLEPVLGLVGLPVVDEADLRGVVTTSPELEEGKIKEENILYRFAERVGLEEEEATATPAATATAVAKEAEPAAGTISLRADLKEVAGLSDEEKLTRLAEKRWQLLNRDLNPEEMIRVREDGELIVTATEGDLAYNNARFVLVREAPDGDFEATAMVEASLDARYQQIAIVVMKDKDGKPDQDNYIKTGMLYNGEEVAMEMPEEVEGKIDQDSISYLSLDKQQGKAQIRVVKKGKLLVGYYSPDGEDWTKIGSRGLGAGPIYIGLAAMTTQGKDTDIFIEDFQISEEGR